MSVIYMGERENTSNKRYFTIINILSTFIVQGLTFFSLPYFSKMLGTENYGVYTIYFTWVQILSIVFSLQAGETIGISRNTYPEEKQKSFQSSVISLAFSSYVVLSLLVFAALSILNCFKVIHINIVILVLALIHGWGMYCVSFVQSKFTYEFKALKNFSLSLTVTLLNIVLSILLIRTYSGEDNYMGLMIGQSLVYAFAGIVLFVYLLIQGKTFYNLDFWKFTLPISFPIVFHLLAIFALNQSDKLMIQWMIDSSSVGIYALVCTFATVINSIWIAFNNSWVPFYYEYTRNNDYESIATHSKNYVELYSVITVGFILLSKEVFLWYAPEDFRSVWFMIPLFVAGYYFVFLYSFPVNFEFFYKKTKTIAVGTILAAIVNILLNIVFIMKWGIIGAAIATAIARLIQFLFHFISVKRLKELKYPFTLRNFYVSIIVVIAACILFYLASGFWYIRWIIGAIIGIYELVKIIKRRAVF